VLSITPCRLALLLTSAIAEGGQFHAPATLLPVPAGNEDGWISEPGSGRREEEDQSCIRRESNCCPSPVNP
jgi:hypothetical protein